MAPLFLVRGCLPHVLEHGTVHVVNISSLAGEMGILCEASYAASKAKLIERSNALRLGFWKGMGVDFSVLCPVCGF
jgi:short-subunit dehydrogenase